MDHQLTNHHIATYNENCMDSDVFEGLYLFNESLHKAGLYLEALGKHDAFEPERISRYVDRLKQVRSATNAYVVGVILKAEAEVGVSA
jgi:hypothetical protein